MPRALARAFVALGTAATLSCYSTNYRSSFTNTSVGGAVSTADLYVKLHMPDGSLYVLEDWSIVGEAPDARVEGTGLAYDVDRHTTGKKERRSVRVADVAVIETTQPERVTHSGGVVLGVVSGASLLVTALCLANPKACFGSCPTFYTEEGGGRRVLQAEGFSASIARTLEDTDVDAMWTAHASRVASGPDAGTWSLSLFMTNDALETHFVDSVRVLAAPRPVGARVYRAGQRYLPARTLHAPLSCASPLGDCVRTLSAPDGDEWRSPADPDDLAAHEALELVFPHPRGKLGVVIHARSSLLNTFVFYQVLAWLGRDAVSTVLAAERAGDVGAERWRAFGRLLGDIDVEVAGAGGTWTRAGAFAEVGPIARETQLVELPDALPEGPLKVRLRVAKGNWKIDAVSLAELLAEVQARPITPDAVLRDGKADAGALAKLHAADGDRLVTYPRDAWELRFRLPDGD